MTKIVLKLPQEFLDQYGEHLKEIDWARVGGPIKLANFTDIPELQHVVLEPFRERGTIFVRSATGKSMLKLREYADRMRREAEQRVVTAASTTALASAPDSSKKKEAEMSEHVNAVKETVQSLQKINDLARQIGQKMQNAQTATEGTLMKVSDVADMLAKANQELEAVLIGQSNFPPVDTAAEDE